MSAKQHARIEKKVINFDAWDPRHIVCCWDDCERDGVELHKATVNYGKPGNPNIVQYVFCSDRHRQYWINSHHSYGNLPSGSGRSF